MLVTPVIVDLDGTTLDVLDTAYFADAQEAQAAMAALQDLVTAAGFTVEWIVE